MKSSYSQFGIVSVLGRFGLFCTLSMPSLLFATTVNFSSPTDLSSNFNVLDPWSNWIGGSFAYSPSGGVAGSGSVAPNPGIAHGGQAGLASKQGFAQTADQAITLSMDFRMGSNFSSGNSSFGMWLLPDNTTNFYTGAGFQGIGIWGSVSGSRDVANIYFDGWTAGHRLAQANGDNVTGYYGPTTSYPRINQAGYSLNYFAPAASYSTNNWYRATMIYTPNSNGDMSVFGSLSDLGVNGTVGPTVLTSGTTLFTGFGAFTNTQTLYAGFSASAWNNSVSNIDNLSFPGGETGSSSVPDTAPSALMLAMGLIGLVRLAKLGGR